jgi:hypothetical protein
MSQMTTPLNLPLSSYRAGDITRFPVSAAQQPASG